MRMFCSSLSALMVAVFMTQTPMQLSAASGHKAMRYVEGPSSQRLISSAPSALGTMPGGESDKKKSNKKEKEESVHLVELSTQFGDMTIMLYNETPQHRDNFIRLSKEGFFNDLLFHRVIKQFMIQGGDPGSKGAQPGTALGTGGPGYTVPAEFNDALIHRKGALSAARMGDNVNPEKASSGSQFYIVQGQTYTAESLESMAARSGRVYTQEQKDAYASEGGTPQLDGAYTVFGQVIKGLEVIDKIAAVSTDPRDRPLEDVKMTLTYLKEEKPSKLAKEFDF